MTSKELYFARSHLAEAEREFKAARNDVRYAARAYEHFRATNPTTSGTSRARNQWNLNVLHWADKAVTLEEALAQVLVLERATDEFGPARHAPAVDLTEVDPSLSPAHDNASQPADEPASGQGRPKDQAANRREEKLQVASDHVTQARHNVNHAYATYRAARLLSTPDELTRLLDTWRHALVVWTQALGRRETAREKVLIGRFWARKNATSGAETTSKSTIDFGDQVETV